MDELLTELDKLDGQIQILTQHIKDLTKERDSLVKKSTDLSIKANNQHEEILDLRKRFRMSSNKIVRLISDLNKRL